MPTVLITGANRGLGLALARHYAAAGWRVHAACRDPAAARDLGALAGDLAVHRLDVTHADQVAALAAALAGEAIDVLVNNAGVGATRGTELGAIDYAKWAEAMAVNAFAPLRVAEAFTPHVAASGRRVMLFHTSRAGSIGDNLAGGRYLYRSSKAALNAVVRSLAIDLRPKRIICLAVHPGWARTDMGGTTAPISPEQSAAALGALIDRLEAHDSGRFLNYDGREIGW